MRKFTTAIIMLAFATILYGSGQYSIAPTGTGTGGGSGSVTSVGLSDSTNFFNITGTPVTSSGTLNLSSFKTEGANTFFGNNTGSTGVPLFTNLSTLAGNDITFGGNSLGIFPDGKTIQVQNGLLTAVVTGSGGGTVTSVGFLDSTNLFNVTGTPVTTSGNLTLSTYKTQSANTFLANNTGSTAAPSFTALSTLAGNGESFGGNSLGIFPDGQTIQLNASGQLIATNTNKGTVTSVGLLDSTNIFNVTGTPVTSNGNLTLSTLKNQSANTFLANDTSGSAAPTFTTLSTLAGNGITFGGNSLGIFPDGQTIKLTSGGQLFGNPGTVTSVAETDATNTFNITGSPITSNGTLSLSSYKSQGANTFLANNTGSTAAPTFTNLSTLAGNDVTFGGNSLGIFPDGKTIQVQNGLLTAVISGSGGGTVNSVGLVDSTNLFNITGTPVTSSGNLTLSTYKTQSADTFLANNTGSTAAPLFTNLSTLAGTGITFAGNSLGIFPDGQTIKLSGSSLVGNSGTVTSVAESDLTNTFNLTGSPITSSGTISISSYKSQSGNTFLANNTNGSAAPTFTALSTLAGNGVTFGGNSLGIFPDGKTIQLNGSNQLIATNTNQGTVTSVGLLDSTNIFNITGTPVTSNGNLTLSTLKNQSANTFLGNNTSGSAAPTFTALSTLAGNGVTFGGNSLGIFPDGQTIQLNSSSQLVATNTNKGTVTSVGFVDSTNLFNVTGSPVTSNGNLTLSTYKTQSADTFLANNTSSTAAPTFTNLSTLAGNGITFGGNSLGIFPDGKTIQLNASGQLIATATGGGGGGGTGVTTVGAFTSTSQPNGATISIPTITFGQPDGVNPGMVPSPAAWITQGLSVGGSLIVGSQKINDSVAIMAVTPASGASILYVDTQGTTINNSLNLNTDNSANANYTLGSSLTFHGVTNLTNIGVSGVVITLPSMGLVKEGKVIVIKDQSGQASGTSVIYVTPNGSDFLDGISGTGGSISIVAPYGALSIIRQNSKWWSW